MLIDELLHINREEYQNIQNRQIERLEIRKVDELRYYQKIIQLKKYILKNKLFKKENCSHFKYYFGQLPFWVSFYFVNKSG
ncbi:unnamed protein product [Paramecium sonneborni]|uniref:Uncharacterized protein n=1 Tax=Paramecium sonneborni TaxID=65129 RepID=A0A8S1MQC2_9CILI|nr:unnamed protein product [Paramecium sonneborni]